jgi:hypothetical protein
MWAIEINDENPPASSSRRKSGSISAVDTGLRRYDAEEIVAAEAVAVLV